MLLMYNSVFSIGYLMPIVRNEEKKIDNLMHVVYSG